MSLALLVPWGVRQSRPPGPLAGWRAGRGPSAPLGLWLSWVCWEQEDVALTAPGRCSPGGFAAAGAARTNGFGVVCAWAMGCTVVCVHFFAASHCSPGALRTCLLLGLALGLVRRT